MASQTSGPISIQDIVDEFGGTAPHSLSEYYRNGGLVPGNNTNVPESGAISLQDFYGATNASVITLDATQENVETATLFGADWTSSIPKRLVINSGVTVGGTGAFAL